ncbi:hypothetical protein D3C80_1463250 [compost metagenome]
MEQGRGRYCHFDHRITGHLLQTGEMGQHRVIAECYFSGNLKAFSPLRVFLGRTIALIQNNFVCACNSQKKIKMPPRTAEFAVSNSLEAQCLFLLQQFSNFSVLNLLKLCSCYLPLFG